jgi:hypothetical protein
MFGNARYPRATWAASVKTSWKVVTTISPPAAGG